MDGSARAVLGYVLVLGGAAFATPLVIGLVTGDAVVQELGVFVLAPVVVMLHLLVRWSRPSVPRARARFTTRTS